jgi:hypothetical protein
MVSAELLPSGGQAPMVLPIVGATDAYSVIALIPKNAPLGSAQIHASFDGIDQGSASVTIVPSSFGLFTNGPVALAQNSLTRPAHPNDVVTLWGTGLGSAAQSQVSVLVGGRPAPMTYAGPAPGSPGLDQLNVRIPNDPAIPEGCYVAVDITVAGVLTNRGSLPFARDPAAACKHPLGLTPEQLLTLDQGGGVTFSHSWISSSIQPSFDPYITDWTKFTRSDYANFYVSVEDAFGVAVASQPAQESDDALFRCSTEGDRSYLVLFDPTAPVPGFGNPGSLSLVGPDGRSVQVPSQLTVVFPVDPDPASFTMDAVPDSFFLPGTWTLTQASGPRLIPFTVALPVGPAIRVTNSAEVSALDRRRDTTVRWNPLGFSGNQIVTVTLYPPDSTAPLSCVSPAQAGALTIPARFLGQLAPSADPLNPSILAVRVSTRVGGLSTFKIGPSGGISGAFDATSEQDIPITIQ